MRGLLLLVTCVLMTAPAYPQSNKRANVWYFGYNAGLDFNGGPPVSLTNGMLFMWEGCASICDEEGSLLFYTNGQKIWNRDHEPMPDADYLGGESSSTQSGIIVPYPGHSNLYYVFSIDKQEGEGGAQYALIDMDLNAGLGGVVSKNNRLLNKANEKLTAIQHCNKRDYWIIVHEWDNNSYRSYLVDSTGINLDYVRSQVGLVQTTYSDPGYLKASPDGTRLVAANYGGTSVGPFIEIYNFNNQTGQITDAITLRNFQYTTAYGVEFSTDGKLLYISYNQTIDQFDLSASTATDLMNNSTVVAKAKSSYFGALQMGPDGKIYIAIDNYDYIGVIHEPNVKGVGCGFVQDGVFLNGKISGIGLPNQINSFEIQSLDVSISSKSNVSGCNSITLESFVSDSLNIIYQWFKDGQPISGARQSTLTPNLPGTYLLKVKTDDCRLLQAESDSLTVAFSDLTPLPTTEDQTICRGERIPTLYVNGPDIKWYADSTLQNQLASGNAYTPAISSDLAGIQTYFLTQTLSTGCVSPPARMQLIIRESPSLKGIQKSYVGCFSNSPVDQLTLKVTENPDAVYNWFAPDGNLLGSGSSIQVQQSGTYRVTIADKQGCAGSDSITVTEYCIPVLAVPDIFTPNGDGFNDVFEIKSKITGRLVLTIYSRWGEVVLHTDSRKWDGAYKGIACPEGVYSWKIEATYFDVNDQPQTLKKTGKVLLIR